LEPSRPARRPDRRRERTQRALEKALLRLILDISYDDIRVEDICQEADIGRATFYLHYTSKNDLLYSALRHLLESVAEEAVRIPDSEQRGLEQARMLFAHVHENRQLYQRLMTSSQAVTVDRQIWGYLIRHVRAEITRLLGYDESQSLPLHVEYLPVHIASALYGLVIWTASAEREIDSEMLSRLFFIMNSAGVQNMIHEFSLK
jgi:AcrR family transcriptional regulator